MEDEDHRLLRLSDRLGGGERRVSFRFDGDTLTWRGTLDKPVPTSGGARWRVAVRSWVLPEIYRDTYDRTFLINMVIPYVDCPICVVGHDRMSVLWGEHVRGQTTRLTWFPVVDSVGCLNSGVSDVAVTITDCGGRRPSPRRGVLHLVLDFAVDEDRSAEEL